MLGHFPPGYPDEVFANICARYQQHFGDASSVPVAKRLFGAQGPVHLHWPIRLGKVVSQLPSDFAVTVDKLIDEHTLAPVLLPFVTSSTMAELRNYMSGSDSGRRLGMIGGAQEEWLTFKYCPICAERDRFKFGEAYWHRVHQPSFVDVCVEHSCYLEIFHNHNALNGKLVPADCDIPLRSAPIFIDPSSPRAAISLWLAQQVKWLLDNPGAAISSANLSTAFTRRFTELGLLTTRGLPDFREIRASFRSYLESRAKIDDEWLKKYKINSDRSLQIAIRRHYGSPALQFLLMNWLGIEARSLLNASTNVYFEDGPWPCLNKVCRFHGLEVIKDYSLGRSHTGVTRGVFTCQCGFSYSRPAPDRDGSTRTKPQKILKTGTEWEERFIALWGDRTITIPEIAIALDCSTTYIRKFAVALDLPLRKNREKTRRQRGFTSLKFEQKRAAYREDVCKFIHQFEGAERTEFYRQLPRQMQWLLQNDREWLEEALPAGKRGGPKVDWRKRDLELCATIHRVRQQFIDEEMRSRYLRPLSRTRFLDELGIHHDAAQEGRYPHTLAAIKEATETSGGFKVRKLFWILRDNPADLPTTFLQLLARLEIRRNMRENDAFVTILRSAEALFMERIQRRVGSIAA